MYIRAGWARQHNLIFLQQSELYNNTEKELAALALDYCID